MKLKKYIIILQFLLIMGCQTIKAPQAITLNDENVFTFKGNNIWYEDIGEGDPLLFIHGLGSSTYTWRYIKEHYSSEYRVICIDLKGFGKSSKPLNSSYTIKEQSLMILDFITKKELKNLTMVGHSYGGAIALTTYLTADDVLKQNINKLVLIDSPAYRQEIPNYVSILRTPIINDISLNVFSPDQCSEMILKILFFDQTLITSQMIKTYGMYLVGENAKNALKKSAENIIPINIDSLTKEYKDISIPVLLIWGKNDNVINKNIGQRLHDNIQNSTFVSIDECGHVPQEEKPLFTIKAIDDFIKLN